MKLITTSGGSTSNDPPKLSHFETKLLQTVRQLCSNDQVLLAAVAEKWLELEPNKRKPSLYVIAGGKHDIDSVEPPRTQGRSAARKNKRVPKSSSKSE